MGDAALPEASWPPAPPAQALPFPLPRPGMLFPAPSSSDLCSTAQGLPRLLNKEAPCGIGSGLDLGVATRAHPESQSPTSEGQQHPVSRLSRCSCGSLPPPSPRGGPPTAASSLSVTCLQPCFLLNTISLLFPHALQGIRMCPPFTPHPHPAQSTAPLRTLPTPRRPGFLPPLVPVPQPPESGTPSPS